MGQHENELLLTSETPKYLQQMQDINQMMYDLFTRMFHAIWKVFQALVRCSLTHNFSNMAYSCTFAHMQRCSGHMELVHFYHNKVLLIERRNKSEIRNVCAVK